jgi:thymidine kinase
MNAYQYKQKGHSVAVVIPEHGTRDEIEEGITLVSSRIGLREYAYCVTPEDTLVLSEEILDAEVLFVDEVQFLTKQQVEELFYLANQEGKLVICYGLLTDFRTNMFEASKRLIELGAKLHLINTIGETHAAPVLNARFVDDKLQLDGALVQVGMEESYRALSLNEYRDFVFEQYGRDFYDTTAVKSKLIKAADDLIDKMISLKTVSFELDEVEYTFTFRGMFYELSSSLGCGSDDPKRVINVWTDVYELVGLELKTLADLDKYKLDDLIEAYSMVSYITGLV